jgi:hypothetical protein
LQAVVDGWLVRPCGGFWTEPLRDLTGAREVDKPVQDAEPYMEYSVA